MDEMVFLNYGPDAVPFTTSEIISEFAGVKHHAVQQILLKYRPDFEELGNIAFQMRKPSAGSKGGRPEKIYELNEEQATLLITYLKNAPQVRAFKKELVRQFYAMRKELTRREINRIKLKPVRRDMTDAIRDYVPDSPHKSMQYVNYTNLAYRTALGMTAKAIRRSRGADRNANAAEFLSAQELAAVKRVSGHISILLESGLSYEDVRQVLTQTNQLMTGKPRNSQ